MLLRHTTEKVAERSSLTVNPAKTCQPVGALYAALGVHSCMPHSHGSQGCCAYHRSALTRHYKEPVVGTTSSFTEGASVFGGQANLMQAINNIFTVYDPEVIAVHTTCLSETIGDDVNQIRERARDKGLIPEGKHVIYASTPSYVGSHVTGYANMVKSLVTSFAEPAEDKLRTVNIIPGWIEPSDMREIKRICSELGTEIIMYPDTSGVLDTPQTGHYEMFPKGGATVEQMAASGASQATIALGKYAAAPAAKALDTQCKVPCDILDLPIGLTATDNFINTLRKVAKVEVPESINDERGRLLDFMGDTQQYFQGKRVALWGDPDQLVSLTEFLVDLGMRPVYIVTGTPGKKFLTRIEKALRGQVPEAKVKQGACADMHLMHQWIKQESVDLLIGNTYGKYISRDEDIPLLRHGFPIYDRVGHSYFPTVGYAGAMRLVEKMLELFLDRKDRDCPEESFELVL
ncbi:MAG: nitrogenase molybdenum-iron protein subunit beta [Sedimentisphaeraceae bacterium JB056]